MSQLPCPSLLLFLFFYHSYHTTFVWVCVCVCVFFVVCVCFGVGGVVLCRCVCVCVWPVDLFISYNSRHKSWAQSSRTAMTSKSPARGQKTKVCIEGEDPAAAGIRRLFSLSKKVVFLCFFAEPRCAYPSLRGADRSWGDGSDTRDGR